jgi:hypothetical protein
MGFWRLTNPTGYDSVMGNPEHGDLIWKNDSGSFEIGTQGTLLDGKPALDEVVATGADVHLEQMDYDQWWMGIQAGGKYFHLWFTLEDGRLCVRLTDQDDENGQWEGDNRERPLPGVDS